MHSPFIRKRVGACSVRFGKMIPVKERFEFFAVQGIGIAQNVKRLSKRFHLFKESGQRFQIPSLIEPARSKHIHGRYLCQFLPFFFQDGAAKFILFRIPSGPDQP